MKRRNPNIFPAGTALHATLIGATDADASSKWIMLVPLGSFSGRNGLGPYDGGDVAYMNQVIDATRKRAGNTELVIDYDHQTVFAAVPNVGGVAPAAGWIKDFEVRPDGLYGLVEWTEKAASAIKANEYRYISPVYHHDKSGKVLRLISAGLTNSPNLDLAAVVASTALNHQDEDMDKIALALGLAAGAKADDIVTAVNSAVTGRVDPTKYVPIAQVVALQSDLNSLKATVQGDKATLAVNKAIEDGKIVPALKDWALKLYGADPAQFDAFVGAAPVLTAVQRATVVPPTNGDPALTNEDLAVMNQLGLSKESFLQVKKGGEA